MSGAVGPVLSSDGLSKLTSEVRNQTELTKARAREWLRHRRDYRRLGDRLDKISDTTQQQVMVPVPSKAMMPGTLVHTNEILVLLGDNWFLETSAKEARRIVGRRME